MSFAELVEALPYFHALTAHGGVYIGEIRATASYGDLIGQRNKINAHGYDVVANRVSSCLGGQAGLDRFFAALAAMGMPCCLDAVFHHSSDQHEDRRRRPQDWDHVRLADGTEFDDTFFGYGWLERYLQELKVLLRLNSSVIDTALKHGCYLRLDHPDGLDDPLGLQNELAALGIRTWWEKILTQDWETLPDANNLLGDTGYRGLDLINRLMHCSDGVAEITQDWMRQCGERRSFEEIDRDCRRRVVYNNRPGDSPYADFRQPFRRAMEALNGDGHALTLEQLADGAASCPVYRPYTPDDGRPTSTQDLRVWQAMNLPEPIHEGVMAGRYPRFVRLLERILPATMAKGREDWAFYTHTAVLGLREVGSGLIPLTRQEFQDLTLRWVQQYPQSLWDTQTHDTKRCLRLRCGSAFNTRNHRQYLPVMGRLFRLAQKHNKDSLASQAVRFILDELLGVWPVDVEKGNDSRFLNYLCGAFRHGRTYTGWRPDELREEWELAMKRFVVAIYNDPDIEQVLVPYAVEMKNGGLYLALSQQLLTIFCSNKMVVYHGSEGPNVRRLMDPWNRESVDYGALLGMLKALKGGAPVTEDTLMMNLIWRGLHAKRDYAVNGTPVEFLDEAPAGVVAVRRGNLVAVASYDPSVAASLPGFNDNDDLLKGRYRGQKIFLIH
jgi:maltooligosyltrehalose synthase